MSTNTPLLSPVEEQAFQLSRCAILIDMARQDAPTEAVSISAALEENLQTWVAFAQVTKSDGSPFSAQSVENIDKLSRYVAQETFSLADGVSKETLDTLININLQVCEGLLEGSNRVSAPLPN